jgi:formamidopyrimidine-DNA glycosylase
MPELPEVETVARDLRGKIPGHCIEHILLCRSSVIKSDRKKFGTKLPGLKIGKVLRRGKYLGLETSAEITLWFHLGMTGQLLWQSSWNGEDPHLHFVLKFEGIEEFLTYRDIRRFGKIFLTDSDLQSFPKGIRFLGPEPLEVAQETFIALYKKRKGKIKSLLLNQQLVAGIGNIYADESLFRAKIHPSRRPCRLSRLNLAALHHSVQKTLQAAIDHGGSTIDDFIHADGLAGDYQKFHRVYGKAGKPCAVCGKAIQRIVLAGRSSFFCSQCQR